MTFNDADTERGERINRRALLRKSAVAAGTVTLGGVGTVAATDEPQRYTTDLSEICISPDNSCLDEEVCSVEGSKQHWTVHTTVDYDGGIHVNLHSYRTVVAVGQTSGIEWSGTGTKSLSVYTSGPFPETVTFTNNLVLTSTETNILLGIQTTFHITINANGDLTAYHLDVDFGCLT